MERFKLVGPIKTPKSNKMYEPYTESKLFAESMDSPLLYAVSSYGRIASIRCKSKVRFNKITQGVPIAKELSLNPGPNAKYFHVRLMGKQSSMHTLARIILETFKGSAPSPKGPLWSLYDANHINGNTWDNRLENLEWITHSENICHAFKDLNRRRTPGVTPVTIREGESYKEACERQADDEKSNPITTAAPHKITLPSISDHTEIEIEGYGKALFKQNPRPYYEVSHGGTLKEVYILQDSMI